MYACMCIAFVNLCHLFLFLEFMYCMERDILYIVYLVVWIFVQTFQFHLQVVLFLTGPFYLDRNLSRGKVHHGDNIQFVYFLHIFDFSSFQ
jgi:hypothetical protein